MMLAEALKSPNVRAFLKALRYGEGTSGPDGYRIMFGGERFDNNFVDHPRRSITKGMVGKQYTSTAAGAYQFLERTWDGLVKQYRFPDFSPESQDLGATALIMGRGAIPALLAGRLADAVRLCNREWASLPGSPDGQPTVTLEQFTKLYTDAGGSLLPNPEEKPVVPFLLAALPALLEAVPKLAAVFGSGTDRSDKNVKAIEVAVEVAKTAVGAVNEQDLVEKLQKDPAAAPMVREAVEAQWFTIVDTAGVPEARKADLAFVQSGVPAYKSPVLIVTVLLLPVLYAIVGAVVGVWGAPFSDDVRSALAGSVAGAIIGGITGYFYGTSASSQRKTEIMADK